MCDRRISTENGVLQCDKEDGHKGMHHATHPGGRIPFPDRHKIKDQDELATFEAQALEVDWPQEGMLEPVSVRPWSGGKKGKVTAE